ncbi:MAG: hypothetical protein Q9219_007386 [cf. Caloplaca sp. 3 TL-2023]
MKSFIISAAIGIAIVAIPGVVGLALPADANTGNSSTAPFSSAKNSTCARGTDGIDYCLGPIYTSSVMKNATSRRPITTTPIRMNATASAVSPNASSSSATRNVTLCPVRDLPHALLNDGMKSGLIEEGADVSLNVGADVSSDAEVDEEGAEIGEIVEKRVIPIPTAGMSSVPAERTPDKTSL